MSVCENCPPKKLCSKYLATGGHVEECEYSMDNYTATEVAYKNGYDKGYAEAVDKFSNCLKKYMEKMCWDEDAYIPYPFTFVDRIAMELKNSKD
jgi:hypothetical protein